MKNIYFDVSAVLILLVLLLAVYLKKMTKGDINKYYLLLLFVSFATSLADIWAVAMENNGYGDEALRYVAHASYLILRNSVTPLFIMYVSALTDSWMTGKYRLLKHAVFMLPVVIDYALILLNFFNHKVFYLDDALRYTRGPWLMILYMVAAFYVIYGIVKVVRCWSLFDVGRWLSLILCVLFMIMATLIQLFNPDLLLEMLSGALGLLFIRMMVQRPEEMIDPETGLLSRSIFLPRVYYTQRRSKRRMMILLCIKDYARFHANIGYDREKVILRTIGSVLLDYSSDMYNCLDMYHIGRGRFIAVMKEKSDQDLIDVIPKGLYDLFSKPLVIDGIEIKIDMAVCVVDYLRDIDDPSYLSGFIADLQTGQYPDEVLYAKDIFNQSRYDILHDIDEILEDAIKNKRFEVYYQPIYSVNERCFRTAEALVRLYDDVYGFIPPDLFIPAAEKSGAIRDIGRIVLEEVCSFIASDEYRDLGLHYIEVNLSVIECMEPGLVDQVLDTFKRHHIAANEVNLEITETAVSDSMEVMDDNINRLFNEGICFSLDDFGTGYSNMHRIASLPLSIIKIDKTIVDDSENITMQIVIENTVKMVKSLGMKIVVEGVETKTQLEHFEYLRCDYIQGYYFSKPLPKDEFVSFIRAQANG